MIPKDTQLTSVISTVDELVREFNWLEKLIWSKCNNFDWILFIIKRNNNKFHKEEFEDTEGVSRSRKVKKGK
jgi:hypothetical protein